MVGRRSIGFQVHRRHVVFDCAYVQRSLGGSLYYKAFVYFLLALHVYLCTLFFLEDMKLISRMMRLLRAVYLQRISGLAGLANVSCHHNRPWV